MLACVRIAWQESAPAAWQTWLAAAWESRCGLRVGPGLSPTQECYFCSPFLSLKLQPRYHLLCGLHCAGKFTLPCGILHFVCLPRGSVRGQLAAVSPCKAQSPDCPFFSSLTLSHSSTSFYRCAARMHRTGPCQTSFCRRLTALEPAAGSRRQYH